MAVELVLVVDVFALAQCVCVDCIVNMVLFVRCTEAVPAKRLGKMLLILYCAFLNGSVSDVNVWEVFSSGIEYNAPSCVGCILVFSSSPLLIRVYLSESEFSGSQHRTRFMCVVLTTRVSRGQ